MQLDAVQARVVGSLVEKELTTPQQYPLTLHALVAACNQASNREPVMQLSEEEVQGALDALRETRVVRVILPSHGRSVVRYRHVLDEALGLEARARALLAMLLLRGPQTVGELRMRTERMAPMDRLDDVETELRALANRSEPLVVRLPRQPGQKEERYADLISPVSPVRDAASSGGVGSTGSVGSLRSAGSVDRGPSGAARGAASALDVEVLRGEVAEIRSALALLREDFDTLRRNLGG